MASLKLRPTTRACGLLLRSSTQCPSSALAGPGEFYDEHWRVSAELVRTASHRRTGDRFRVADSTGRRNGMAEHFSRCLV